MPRDAALFRVGTITEISGGFAIRLACPRRRGGQLRVHRGLVTQTAAQAIPGDPEHVDEQEVFEGRSHESADADHEANPREHHERPDPAAEDRQWVRRFYENS